VGWKRPSVCDSDLYSGEISNGAIIGCSYKLCVKVVNKSIHQSKPCLESSIHATVFFYIILSWPKLLQITKSFFATTILRFRKRTNKQ
jgi:hypothetical protein